MKVKLLKKIRKRYEIKYWPNGLFIDGDYYSGPIMRLVDLNSMFRECTYRIAEPLSKEEAYNLLYERLLTWIQQEYGTFKSRRRKITSEKLWYDINPL